MYDPKVFLLTKIKHEYSIILYNLTHFPGPLVCRIRQVLTFCTIWHISLVPWCVGLDRFHCIIIHCMALKWLLICLTNLGIGTSWLYPHELGRLYPKKQGLLYSWALVTRPVIPWALVTRPAIPWALGLSYSLELV